MCIYLKKIKVTALALLSLPVHAHFDEYVNSRVTNNDFIICHTKDGLNFEINTALFPGNIVINGMSLSLYRTMNSDNGYRYYEYLDDIGGKIADLVIGDEEKFLLISRKKAECLHKFIGKQ